MVSRRFIVGAWLGLVGLVAAGCDEEPVIEAVSEAVCASQERWVGGDEGSASMRPGHDCMGCHQAEDAPVYAAAGTVFAALHEVDDCVGVAGVEVAITDGDDVVHTVTTNAAGNFWLDPGDTVAPPYTVTLRFEGRESAKIVSQHDPNCASCHTAEGAHCAPGRLTAP